MPRLHKQKIQKRKISVIDGHAHDTFSWPVERLGEDEYGTWVGSLRGTPVTQPDGQSESQPDDAVWLITAHAWWIVAFWFTDETDLTVDICAPVTFANETWTFLDLELDLSRAADGRSGIVDRDELNALVEADHLHELHAQLAIDAADELLPRVEDRHEPFGERGRHWLEVLRSRDR